jgi:hypothetical protein
MDQTGLNRKTIDGCYDLMPAIFGDTRRDAVGRNKKLYDSNALVLLQRVRSMRDDGKHLPEIKLILEEELASHVGNQSISEGKEPGSAVKEHETNHSVGNTNGWHEPHLLDVIDILRQSHKDIVTEKDRTIAAKDEVINSIQDRVLLLEEGRLDRDSIQKDSERLRLLVEKQEERAERRKELIASLKEAAGIGKGGVRKRLLVELELLDGPIM